MSVYDPDLISDDPAIRRIDWIVKRIGNELMRAQDRFGPMVSPHEGIAVIEEEFLELRKEVFERDGRAEPAIIEAIQLAAMAARYVFDLERK